MKHARFLFVILLFVLAIPASQALAQEEIPVVPQDTAEVLEVQASFTQIVAGEYHMCGLTTVGGVKCWGANNAGQLGDGTNYDRSAPVDVSGLTSGVTALTAGGDHTCAVVNGGVRCWGYNSQGELGDGSTSDRNVPVNVSGLSSGVRGIAAGYSHTCAVTNSGAVRCWGSNEAGQLGDGTLETRLTPVNVSGLSSGIASLAAGYAHTCAVSTGGAAKCWGANEFGQVGDGSTDDRRTPVNVSGLSSSVTAMTAGGGHTCAIANGGAKCWGYNEYGQVGDGTKSERYSPVNVSGLSSGVTSISAGSAFTCAVASGGVKCWGENLYGQLGNGTNEESPTPVNVSGLGSGYAATAAGGSHACALASNGSTRCWGDNQYGQLGNGDSPTRMIPGDISGLTAGISSLSAGSLHTCALTTGGGVKCWGENSSGQLGDGTKEQSSTPVDVSGLTSSVASIALGGNHSCAVTTAGAARCWGSNQSGEVGDGSYSDRTAPVTVSGLGSGVAAMAAGQEHTCALTTGGGVKCWGANTFGQLGNGSKKESTTPVDVTGLGSGVLAITAGGNHTCAIVTGRGLKCWGANFLGQLGTGNFDESTTPVNVSGLSSGVDIVTAGESHTCALVGGGAKCWGNNEYGQLGDGSLDARTTPVNVSGLGSGVIRLVAGDWHTCAVVSGNAARCWGDGFYGQLGNGSAVYRNTPTPVTGMAAGVGGMTAGGGHTCALVGNGRPKCWGWQGHATLSLTPVAVADSITRLSLNYPNGKKGSFFTVTGENYAPNSAIRFAVNGRVLSSSLTTNATGGFIVFLNTAQADDGNYRIAVSVGPRTDSVTLNIATAAAQRPQEGGGQTLNIPAGIAGDEFFIHLPVAIR